MRTLMPANAAELDKAAEVIRALNPEKRWVIRINPHRAKRSTEQNALLWAIYAEIAKETGNDANMIHEAMKARFLAPVMVQLGEEEVPINGSSAKLDTKEFSEFVTAVQAFAASELGILL